MAWLNDETDRATVAFKYDGDGTVWARAYAVAGATGKTPVQLFYSNYGWIASAVTDVSDVQTMCYIGVPRATYSSGVFGWFQVGGYHADIVTVACTSTRGDGLKLASSVIITSGATANDGAVAMDNEFAALVGTATSVASHSCVLFPCRIDAAD